MRGTPKAFLLAFVEMKATFPETLIGKELQPHVAPFGCLAAQSLTPWLAMAFYLFLPKRGVITLINLLR